MSPLCTEPKVVNMEISQDSENISNSLSGSQILVGSANSSVQNLDSGQLEDLIAEYQLKQIKLLKDMTSLNENCIKVLKFLGWYIW